MPGCVRRCWSRSLYIRKSQNVGFLPPANHVMPSMYASNAFSDTWTFMMNTYISLPVIYQFIVFVVQCSCKTVPEIHWILQHNFWVTSDLFISSQTITLLTQMPHDGLALRDLDVAFNQIGQMGKHRPRLCFFFSQTPCCNQEHLLARTWHFLNHGRHTWGRAW